MEYVIIGIIVLVLILFFANVRAGAAGNRVCN